MKKMIFMATVGFLFISNSVLANECENGGLAQSEANFLVSIFASGDYADERKKILESYFQIDGIRENRFDAMEQVSYFFTSEKKMLTDALNLDEREENIIKNYYELRMNHEMVKLRNTEKKYKNKLKKHKNYHKETSEISDMKYGETKIIPTDNN